MLKRALLGLGWVGSLACACNDAAPGEPHPASGNGAGTAGAFATAGTSAFGGGSASGGASSGAGGALPMGAGGVAIGGTGGQGGDGGRAGTPSEGAGGLVTTAGTTASSGAAGAAAEAGGSATSGRGGSTPGGAGGRGGVSSGGKSGAGTGGVGGSSGASPATAGSPETKPLGYGRDTTGGGSASPVTAATLAAVQAAIDAYAGSGGLVINYTGHFDFAVITDPCAQWQKEAQIVEIKKKNDITILGSDGSAANFGLHIAASSSNIIVRNMTLGLLPGGDASDAISIEGMSGGVPTDIWLDHNELFSSLADCEGAGDSSFDGLIDLKKGADRVTVSYNYLHDHHKVSLNGFSDSDDAARHVTFHHNVFENIASRTPLQRHGLSHLLNNTFTKITTSGINVRMDGYSLVEGNYFDQVQNAVTSRDSDALGFWELKNNNVRSPADFATYGLTWEPSDSSPTKDATDWSTTAPFPEPLGYTYTADPAECLKGNLMKFAGAGKGLATLRCP